MRRPLLSILRRSALRLAVLCLAALALPGAAANAGTLRITPVRVEIAPGKQFCALTITNDGDRAVSVQLRGFGWRNDAQGGDILDPDHGPVLNPGIATLASGEARVVRCSVPAQAVPAPHEESWRLLVDELPAPPAEVAAGTVQTLLRLSIPVFRTPAGAAPDLHWSIDGGALVLTNSGNAHARLVALNIQSATGKLRLARPLYLLARSQARIELPENSVPLSINAETPEGPLPVVAESTALHAAGR